MSFHVSLVGRGSPHREAINRIFGRGSRPASSATATRRGSFPVSDACSRCSESAASRSCRPAEPPGHGAHRGTQAACGWSWSPRVHRPVGCRSAGARRVALIACPKETPRASTNRLWAACREQIALDRDRLRRVGSGSTFSNVNRSGPRSHRRLGSVRSLGVNFRSAHNYVEPAA